jgi:hypothetical protein
MIIEKNKLKKTATLLSAWIRGIRAERILQSLRRDRAAVKIQSHCRGRHIMPRHGAYIPDCSQICCSDPKSNANFVSPSSRQECKQVRKRTEKVRGNAQDCSKGQYTDQRCRISSSLPSPQLRHERLDAAVQCLLSR